MRIRVGFILNFKRNGCRTAHKKIVVELTDVPVHNGIPQYQSQKSNTVGLRSVIISSWGMANEKGRRGLATHNTLFLVFTLYRYHFVRHDEDFAGYYCIPEDLERPYLHTISNTVFV